MTWLSGSRPAKRQPLVSYSFVTVCKSCRVVRCCPPQKGHHTRSRLHLPFPMLFVTASLPAASLTACAHSLWIRSGRTLCAHRGPSSATCHRHFSNERAPPNKCRPIRAGLPRRRRRRRPKPTNHSGLRNIINAVQEFLAHQFIHVSCSSSMVNPSITLCHKCWNIPIKLSTGCGNLSRPTTCLHGHLRQKSRPGPKSGVGHRLTALIVFMRCSVSHSVRVPALSVGAGGGNTLAHQHRPQVPKPNGIQVNLGKHDPTHNWSKYVKRSFQRACNRAIQYGHTQYKGRVLTVKGDHDVNTHIAPPRRLKHTHSHRSLQIYCRNVGLGSGLYEDLMSFLDQSHYDIALIQETKLQNDSENITPQWICVGSGTPAQRHAGVLVLIRRALTDVAAVRHTAVVPRRLLRVRFPLGKSTRMISVICAYQHAWAPRDPHNMDRRQEFWLR